MSNGSAFNKYARSRGALRKLRNQKIILMATDDQPCIKLFHVAVDVILVASKLMDVKDVTINYSGKHSRRMGGIGWYLKYKFIGFS